METKSFATHLFLILSLLLQLIIVDFNYNGSSNGKTKAQTELVGEQIKVATKVSIFPTCNFSKAISLIQRLDIVFKGLESILDNVLSAYKPSYSNAFSFNSILLSNIPHQNSGESDPLEFFSS